jgi:hypothetical protein
MCAAGSTGNPSEPASLANLTTGMANFRTEMHKHGIPAGISEDWDRPGLMSGPLGADGLGVGLSVVGAALEPVLDFVHAHVMAYYHNVGVAEAWNYTANQILWYKKYLPQLPLVISEVREKTSYFIVLMPRIDDVGYWVQCSSRGRQCHRLRCCRGERCGLYIVLEDGGCKLCIHEGA